MPSYSKGPAPLDASSAFQLHQKQVQTLLPLHLSLNHHDYCLNQQHFQEIDEMKCALQMTHPFLQLHQVQCSSFDYFPTSQRHSGLYYFLLLLYVFLGLEHHHMSLSAQG
ncbi:hypothetical protein V8G54_010327 [Vigna mungo]|uniref:Uncharacterized protein n=1 Tax=Vigna mungo TaxID=3915 RepID=A0AAQ3NWU9_VIGMU